MEAIDSFEDAIARAKHLVDLYDLLHNRRRRRARADWTPRAKEIFGWNVGDTLTRIDGTNSVLLIRNPDGWDLEHFEHGWLGELLRSAIVAAVSALDRYFHDLLTQKLLDSLRGTPPKALVAVEVSVVDAEKMIKKALESRRGDCTRTRPRTMLKDSFRKVLNQRTYQGPRQIEEAWRMLGRSKCWKEIAEEMEISAEDVCKNLSRIVARRNKIVHEGDIKQASRPREVRLNEIDSVATRQDIEWLDSLVRAIESLVT